MKESVEPNGWRHRLVDGFHRMPTGVFVGIVAAALLFALFRGVTLPSVRPSPRASTEPLTVNTIRARVDESIYEIRGYAGVVKAARTSDLSFESGGRIAGVLVKEGDVVTVGQPLAQLDSGRLALKKQTLTDALERAQTKLAELNPDEPAATPEQQRSRIQLLQRELNQMLADLRAEDTVSPPQPPSGMDRLGVIERQVGSMNETSRARQIDELEKLEADLQGQLKDTQLQLDAGTLTAPFDGVIALRHLDEGAVAGQGMPVLRLVEKTTPEAWVGIPVNVAARIEPGQNAWLEVGQRTWTGVLSAKLPQLDRTNRTRTVILEFTEPQAVETVIPGEVVNVNIWVENRQTGIWVPISALNRESEGLWSVLVVEGPSDKQSVSWRYVELARLETDHALVTGTLDAGDEVIVNGIHRIVPGQTVISQDVSDTVFRPGPGGDPGQ